MKIVRNKTEKMFSKSLRQSNLWGIKIESNPLAHQQQPGDYILTFDKYVGEISHMQFKKHYTILVEAKQVTLKDGKGRFAFKRFKNQIPLTNFSKNSYNHKGFLLLTYNETMWANSEIYLIPIEEWNMKMKDWPMVSLNRADANKIFGHHKYSIQTGSIIDIKAILEVNT